VLRGKCSYMHTLVLLERTAFVSSCIFFGPASL
jgi:hypothetical protein